jgi:uncharacterized cofD-like protein
MKKKPNIVVIGGGTGTYTVLQGLKKYPVNLSVIVSMMDSGGSNRILRDEFGILPTSDIRQCMVALAGENTNDLVRDLFTYRYHQGTGIEGMTFGNLFMAALSDIYGSQQDAIEKTCKFLGVKGNIIPVTYDNAHLVARYANGAQVLGEHAIDEPDENNGNNRIVELSLMPDAKANIKAIEAIKTADVIVLGPGDLYTSIICNLVVDGIADAINKSKAKKVFVVNMMTKFGQTNGFSASTHLGEIEKYLGKESIDVCLVNKKNGVPKNIMERYEEEHADMVENDIKSSKNLLVIEDIFQSDVVHKNQKADKLKRSLIRHDSDKLAKVIFGICNEPS